MAAEMQRPAPPRTPTRNRWSGPNMRPPMTPGSRSDGIHSGRSTRIGERSHRFRSGGRARPAPRPSSNNGSPTRQGFRNVRMGSDDEEADLSADVIALLQSENVELRSLVEHQLRHLIRVRE